MLLAIVLAFVWGVPPAHAAPIEGLRTSAHETWSAGQPALYQAGCPTPRPAVRLQTQALGDGKIQVTVTAGSGALTLLRFGAMQGSHVELPGSGQSYGSNAEIKPADGATSLTFLLVANPTAQAGQAPPPATVSLTVYDGCGPNQPWSTFIGGGTSALQSMASVADTQVAEGNAGNSVVTFTITLSVPSARSITIGYATADGTAKAGTDYLATTGNVTFNPGETSRTVTVQVRGNLAAEPDKTFTLTLSSPVNAGISRAQATARILNDDTGASASGDSYAVTLGQTLNVGAGSGPPAGLLANDTSAAPDLRIVSFGGLNAGGDVTSNVAGSTANLGNGGSLKVNADGSFTFIAPTNASGSFSFRYRATSAAGDAEATAIITLSGSAPNAVDDGGYSVSAPTPLQVNTVTGLLANDALGNPPGAITSFGGGSVGGTVTSTPAGQARDLGNGGSLTVSPDGSFAFTAPSTANGPFTFQYRLASAAGSDDATVTIDVRAFVNKAPVGTAKTISIGEDTTYPFTAADFGFTDPNNSPPNALKAVKITSLPEGGTLKLGGTVIVGPQDVSVAQITAGSLTFVPAANQSGAPFASFTFLVQDDGGTANGGVDTDTTQRTLTINVTPVNDAPAAVGDTYTGYQDVVLTVPAGTGVLQNDTDLDSAPATFVASLATGPANAKSFTLNPDGSFSYAPKALFVGEDTFTYTVSDGGLSSAAATVKITVADVNSAPQGKDKTITIDEDSTYTFKVEDFGFSDPNDSPPNGPLTVLVRPGSGLGALKVENAPIILANVSFDSINAGKLTYTPAANGNGSSYFTLTFKVRDDGDTANGGQDTDLIERTITFNVTPVNDRPQSKDNTVTTLQDVPYTFKPADFGFSDPNDSPPNTFMSLFLQTLPGKGTLKLAGVAFTDATVSFDTSSISNGLLTYEPAPGESGNPYTSFRFQVIDDEGFSDLTPRTMTIAVGSQLIDTGTDSSILGSRSCGIRVKPTRTIRISRIAIQAAVIANGEMKFLIFDRADGSLIYQSTAQAVTFNNPLPLIESSIFGPITLEAGKEYIIGTVTNVSTTYAVDHVGLDNGTITSFGDEWSLGEYDAPAIDTSEPTFPNVECRTLLYGTVETP